MIIFFLFCSSPLLLFACFFIILFLLPNQNFSFPYLFWNFILPFSISIPPPFNTPYPPPFFLLSPVRCFFLIRLLTLSFIVSLLLLSLSQCFSIPSSTQPFFPSSLFFSFAFWHSSFILARAGTSAQITEVPQSWPLLISLEECHFSAAHFPRGEKRGKKAREKRKEIGRAAQSIIREEIKLVSKKGKKIFFLIFWKATQKFFFFLLQKQFIQSR